MVQDDPRGGSFPGASPEAIHRPVSSSKGPSLEESLSLPERIRHDTVVEIIGDQLDVGRRGVLLGPHRVDFNDHLIVDAGMTDRDRTRVRALDQFNVQIIDGNTVYTTGIHGGNWSCTFSTYGSNAGSFCLVRGVYRPRNAGRSNDLIAGYGGQVFVLFGDFDGEHLALVKEGTTVYVHGGTFRCSEGVVQTGVGGGKLVFSGPGAEIDAPVFQSDSTAEIEVVGADRVEWSGGADPR